MNSTYTTEAFVLKSYNLADADKIVICLTRDYGLVRGVAKGVRRLKSQFGASVEPFTQIELTYFEREGRELVYFQKTEILNSHFEVGKHLESFNLLAFFSELVTSFTPPRDPNIKLYDLLAACLTAFRQHFGQLEKLQRYFSVWFLSLSGFLPDFRRCAVCRRLFGATETIRADSAGRFCCAVCRESQGAKVSPNIIRELQAIKTLSPQAYLGDGSLLSQPERQEMERLLSILLKGMID